jgi:hypothetical protein
MRLSFCGRPRSVTVAAFFFSVTTLAHASFVDEVTVRPSPGYQEVVQGADGTVKFRILGPLGFSIVLDSFDPFFLYTGTIDDMDEITKIARTGGTCGVGTILESTSSGCTYTLGFVTDDPRRPLDPNTDFGLWHVDLRVKAHALTDPENMGSGIGIATVAVLDPGAVVTPEPGTFALAALAMVCLIGVGRVRHRWQRAPAAAIPSLPGRPPGRSLAPM